MTTPNQDALIERAWQAYRDDEEANASPLDFDVFAAGYRAALSAQAPASRADTPAEARAEARILELEAALHAARGWVVTCSDNATARRDLRLIDASLVRPQNTGGRDD